MKKTVRSANWKIGLGRLSSIGDLHNRAGSQRRLTTRSRPSVYAGWSPTSKMNLPP